ncbi:MAG: hypothetical protein J1F35_06930 [Erysipelotrichales bacterium]|nr:hypothetical protein [Erysipelotrichales bacterium]
MLEFIISNYIMFIVAGIVLLLGLFGYMMDKKKYKQYREEIVNEQKAIDSLENAPDIDNVATPVMLDNMTSSNAEQPVAPVIQDVTPQPETTQN